MVDKEPVPNSKPVAEKAVSQREEAEKRAVIKKPAPQASREIGGYQGPEPTRFGDWEKKGRCIDF